MGSQVSVRDDEIDLFEIWDVLVAEKLTILAVFVLSIVVASFVIFSMKPVYKSTAYVLPPLEYSVHEMNKLNLLTGESTKFTSKEVFDSFLKNLSSHALKTEVFSFYHLEKVYAPKLAELTGNKKIMALNQAWNGFGKDFVITPPKKNDLNSVYSVSLAMKCLPEQVSTVLNDMVERARQKTLDQIYKMVSTERADRLQEIQNEIAVLRKMAFDIRKDRIAQLDEAIGVAQSLNIAEPKEVGPEIDVRGLRNQGLPLYYLGYKLLQGERDSLAIRQSDEPFIEGLRVLQGKVAQLENCKIDKDAFGIVRIDQAGFPASSSVRPNKKAMLMLAGVFSLILGSCVALLRGRLKKHRKKAKSLRENS